ncbi:MAG: c-type cytochrome [Gammaproteobacteria bacterium]|nr:c-type cytochrome [Gammaproteobacteria bacterium]
MGRYCLSRALIFRVFCILCLSWIGFTQSILGEEEGNAAAGEGKATACVACHGNDGTSTIPDYPHIGGQNAKYLEIQMRQMRDGERDIPLMAGQLDSMTNQDLKDIAAYYASQPGKIGQASPENLELGERIYRGGILEKKVAACTACHSPNGNGNTLAGFPRISGQPIGYTVAQLKSYREEERTSDEYVSGMMRDIAARMTDSEIEAVANYIQGLY